MSRICTECGQPIVLVPSARERAKATGKPASYFERLFTIHTDCELAKRERETLELLRKKQEQETLDAINKRFPRKGGPAAWLVVSHIGD